MSEGFSFDFASFEDYLLNHTPRHVFVDVFAIIGWIFFFYMAIYALIYFWKEYKEHKYVHGWKWVLLALDIPPLNVQTPKAVEQLFSHLAGAYDPPNIARKFRSGDKQRWFSFEIISIEGYIQFLIRTEESLRDLVEASVYAQYPEAEITEVEDYVGGAPSVYPNETHDLWAADFSLTEDDAYPIRTYREFEHSISKDTVLKDPMGTFLESFTRIGPGEQMWFQIIVEPTGSSWKEKAIKKINEMIGAKGGSHHGISDMVGEWSMKFLERVGDEVFNREASEATTHEESAEPNLVRYMTPGQKVTLEGMELKISKLGFKTKMRGIYVARKDVFRPVRGVQALVGAITQFNIPSANSLAPTFGVRTSYLFKKQRAAHRKTRLMQAYKKRKLKVGANPFILNIEELATVWHFPMSHVKTPLLQKATAKKTEPPPSLPVEEILPIEPAKTAAEIQAETKKTYRTDAGDVGYTSDTRFG